MPPSSSRPRKTLVTALMIFLLMSCMALYITREARYQGASHRKDVFPRLAFPLAVADKHASILPDNPRKLLYSSLMGPIRNREVQQRVIHHPDNSHSTR
jgi:hypothetical protein